MYKLSLIFCAAFLSLLSASANSSEVTLRLVYGTEQAFPNILGQGSAVVDPPGLAIDIIKQAAQDIGVKIELHRLPDKRLFIHLKNGKADGNFIQSFKVKRQEFGVYPMKDGKPDPDKRISTSEYFLYKMKGSPLQATTESLTGNGVRLAAKRGFSIVSELRALGAEVTETESSQSLYKMLISGRVNGIALQANEGDFHINSLKIENIEKVFPPLATKNYYLMLSHQFVEKHPEIASKLWQRIATIRDKVSKDRRAVYEKLYQAN